MQNTEHSNKTKQAKFENASHDINLPLHLLSTPSRHSSKFQAIIRPTVGQIFSSQNQHGRRSSRCEYESFDQGCR
ncbi:UNVERIFIED_CONTAM: hypothetical protein NY603_25285, partial [Bacteroidetes bacterium 56_B9]